MYNDVDATLTVHARTARLEASLCLVLTLPSLAIIISLGISSSLLSILFGKSRLFGREFFSTVLKARVFPVYNYLVCWLVHQTLFSL